MSRGTSAAVEAHAKVARLVSESGGIITTAALLRGCTRREPARLVLRFDRTHALERPE